MKFVPKVRLSQRNIFSVDPHQNLDTGFFKKDSLRSFVGTSNSSEYWQLQQNKIKQKTQEWWAMHLNKKSRVNEECESRTDTRGLIPRQSSPLVYKVIHLWTRISEIPALSTTEWCKTESYLLTWNNTQLGASLQPAHWLRTTWPRMDGSCPAVRVHPWRLGGGPERRSRNCD